MATKKNQQPAVCHGHSRPIVEVNFSPVTPDGYFLVSASKDGQPMLRDGPTGDWIGTFMGHKGAVWSCVLDATATLAATASADFSAKLWDPLTGLEKATFQHKHIVRTIAFSGSGSKLATGGMEKLLRIYDCERPDAAPLTLPPAPSGVRSAMWQAPGAGGDSLLFTALADTPGVALWDLRAGGVVSTLPTPQPVNSLDLTFDGGVLTTTDGSTVRFWDAQSLAPIKAYELPFPTEAASYCPAKGKFAAGGGDVWVHLYRFSDGGELECLKGHHGPVHTVRFGPEGREYASGSEDGTIRIWQTDWLEQQGAAASPDANGAA